MRAVLHDQYGPPEVLELRDVDAPEVGDHDVLVRVRATTVNRTDCGYRLATPWFVRYFTGLRAPRRRILGSEFAGEVVSVGDAVTRFAPGQRVFGVNAGGLGAHAELMRVADTGAIATMPDGWEFAELAGACDGAMVALASLRRIDSGPGRRLLVYGASGAIGSAAVQLAKHFGAEVTAVCDTDKVDAVSRLGADRVIDRGSIDFSREGEVYDFVLDAVGKSSFRVARRCLAKHGIYASTDGGWLWQNPFLAVGTGVARRGKRAMFPLPTYDQAGVEFIRDLLEQGQFRPLIDDHSWPLEEIIKATRYVETGQKTGNVIIHVDE